MPYYCLCYLNQCFVCLVLDPLIDDKRGRKCGVLSAVAMNKNDEISAKYLLLGGKFKFLVFFSIYIYYLRTSNLVDILWISHILSQYVLCICSNLIVIFDIY